MWVLFGLCAYAMYSGIQARRTRTSEIEVRKTLAKKKFGLKHHQIGSVVLVLMVFGALGALAVTYVNNGKLFVGPHLLIGLGMTGLIASSAALVPFMQRGNEIARVTHIGINTVVVSLFGWQAVSGMEILGRIIGRM